MGEGLSRMKIDRACSREGAHARELKGWRVTGLVVILLSAQAVSAETHEVTLLDQQPFTIPGPTMIIASGDTVTWINPPREGGGMHTVTQNG